MTCRPNDEIRTAVILLDVNELLRQQYDKFNIYSLEASNDLLGLLWPRFLILKWSSNGKSVAFGGLYANKAFNPLL